MLTKVWGRIKQVSKIIFTFVGGIYTLYEALKFFLGQEHDFVCGYASFCHDFWWCIFIIILVISIYKTKELKSVTSTFMNDMKIEVRVTDILETKGSYVIGVGTCFDTDMKGGVISETSLFGQFINKHFKKHIATLDSKIDEALYYEKHDEVPDSKKGKKKRYKIGTFVPLKIGKLQTAYLLATNHTNNRGNVCNSDLSDISQALLNLWQYIPEQRIDIDEEIAVPLLGGKFFGLTVSKEKIIHEILKSFIVCSQQRRVCDKLVICISPKDFKNSNIKLEELKCVIDYLCKNISANEDVYSGVATAIA